MNKSKLRKQVKELRKEIKSMDGLIYCLNRDHEKMKQWMEDDAEDAKSSGINFNNLMTETHELRQELYQAREDTENMIFDVETKDYNALEAARDDIMLELLKRDEINEEHICDDCRNTTDEERVRELLVEFMDIMLNK